ncbi:kinase-like domain-containing protein [Rhizophagus irregularis DAOM 181602=DAOM 197198]|nr:kinase-like domain-containing protein [Rhizophagus irregularis DAOM 181602=DAOM 197198]
MFVILKNLNNLEILKLEYIGTFEPHRVYGVTQNPLLAHNDAEKALEWIPYDKVRGIKCIVKDEIYKANWIDGYINKWDDENQKWKRKNHDMIVILRRFNSPENNLLKFINESLWNNSGSKDKTLYDFITLNVLQNEFIGFHEVYGITKDPETKNFIVAFNEECKKYKHVCNALHFQQNFKNWTSGNSDIDGFVQYIQLSSHSYNACHALEWIPYNKFYDIEYIAKGGFGKVYKANWKDGCIDKWDDENQNWRRKNQNMLVALKSLNNSKNVTLEFMNEITSHCKVNLGRCIVKLYGITQDPETENYAMVLDFAEDGDLRNYLNKNHNKLYLNDKINYLHSITRGLADIHKNELIHRDLHIEDIYTSRLLNFNNLPEPKNSVDYYDNQNDDIISMESSEYLQIDFHKLKNDDDNIPEQKISDDYYEKNDNSESLEIDISQLKITDNIFFVEKNSDEYDDKQNDNMIKMEFTASLSLQIDVSQLNINEDDQSNKSKGVIIQND